MVARLVRDQKVAGSNPVTSTKILSEDYDLQTFLLFCFARFFLRNPSLPDQTRISADKPPFGCHRMTTDRGGFMELRVWFLGAFRSGMFIGRSGWKRASGMGKKMRPKGVLLSWVRLFLYSIRFGPAMQRPALC